MSRGRKALAMRVSPPASGRRRVSSYSRAPRSTVHRFGQEAVCRARRLLASVAAGSAQTYAVSAGVLRGLRDQIFNFVRCGWRMILAYIGLEGDLRRLQVLSLALKRSKYVFC